jgi:hypothetical protein
MLAGTRSRADSQQPSAGDRRRRATREAVLEFGATIVQARVKNVHESH